MNLIIKDNDQEGKSLREANSEDSKVLLREEDNKTIIDLEQIANKKITDLEREKIFIFPNMLNGEMLKKLKSDNSIVINGI
jgi:hypothetical protein